MFYYKHIYVDSNNNNSNNSNINRLNILLLKIVYFVPPPPWHGTGDSSPLNATSRLMFQRGLKILKRLYFIDIFLLYACKTWSVSRNSTQSETFLFIL